MATDKSVLKSTDTLKMEFMSPREKFNLLQPSRRLEIIGKMPDEEVARLEYDWEWQARPKQLSPDYPQSKATSFCMCKFLEAQAGTDKKLKLEQFPPCDEISVPNRTEVVFEKDGKPLIRAIPDKKPCQYRTDWSVWVLLAGRGFGKTRVGAELVKHMVLEGHAKRISIISPTAADARDVAVEGESGLLAISPPWNKPIYESTKRRITWPNGAIASLFSAEEPERLRGPQFDLNWSDELAAWDVNSQQMVWDMMNFGLRLGKNPRSVVTTTPKPTILIQNLVKMSKDPVNRVIITTGSTYENRTNLAAPFMRQITQYEGTNLGRQEIYAELIDIEESGIIKRTWFKRWPARSAMPFFEFVIQSYDTAFTDNTQNDPTACTVYGVFRPTPDEPYAVMIIDPWKDHLKYPELRKRAKDDYEATYGDQEAKVDMLVIEDKGSGTPLIQDLQRAGLPIRKYNPGRPDKVMRLHAVSHMVYNGRVYIPESKNVPGEFVTWAEDFIREVCAFPNSEHDDYCFVAGTKVTMVDGNKKNIEEMRVGDLVQTRSGVDCVTASECTGKNEIYEVIFSNGCSLKGTGNHPILTVEGWKPLASLNKGEYCVTVNNTESSSCLENMKLGSNQRSVNSTGRSTISMKARDIGKEVIRFFTETFGNSTTVKYQKDSTSTTEMVTLSTMNCQISNSSTLCHTAKFTSKHDPKLQQNGIVQKKEENGIERMYRVLCQRFGLNPITWRVVNLLKNSAKSVELLISRRSQKWLDSVRQNAKHLNLLFAEVSPRFVISGNRAKLVESCSNLQRPQTNTVRQDATKYQFVNSNLLKRTALGVDQNSKEDQSDNTSVQLSTDIRPLFTTRILSVKRLNTTSLTYNLTVDRSHEFIANDIVVHNCDTFSQALAVFRDQEWLQLDAVPRKEGDEEEYEDEQVYENPYMA